MDIRKVVLGGLVAATAVVLPISAASAALAAPPPPPKTNCTLPKPPAPPKPPKHHRKHDGDHIKPGGSGGSLNSGGLNSGGLNSGGGNKHKTPPPPPPGKHNHKPGNSCMCQPGRQAPPPFYSIFEPPSLSALYQTDTWSYTCPPGQGGKPK
jgi:hypothetical protein